MVYFRNDNKNERELCTAFIYDLKTGKNTSKIELGKTSGGSEDDLDCSTSPNGMYTLTSYFNYTNDLTTSIDYTVYDQEFKIVNEGTIPITPEKSLGLQAREVDNKGNFYFVTYHKKKFWVKVHRKNKDGSEKIIEGQYEGAGEEKYMTGPRFNVYDGNKAYAATRITHDVEIKSVQLMTFDFEKGTAYLGKFPITKKLQDQAEEAQKSSHTQNKNKGFKNFWVDDIMVSETGKVLVLLERTYKKATENKVWSIAQELLILQYTAEGEFVEYYFIPKKGMDFYQSMGWSQISYKAYLSGDKLQLVYLERYAKEKNIYRKVIDLNDYETSKPVGLLDDPGKKWGFFRVFTLWMTDGDIIILKRNGAGIHSGRNLELMKVSF